MWQSKEEGRPTEPTPQWTRQFGFAIIWLQCGVSEHQWHQQTLGNVSCVVFQLWRVLSPHAPHSCLPLRLKTNPNHSSL